MATPSLTANLTTINACDTTTGWTGDTFVLDPDNKKQGTNSVSCASTANGVNRISCAVSNVALGTEHVRVWFNSIISSFYAATTGLQLEIVHTGGTAVWNIDPNNDYAGGWINIVVYAGSTPDSGTAVGANTCSSIAIVQNTTAKPRNTINTWADYVRYGDGLIATGGTSGDKIDLAGIAAQDKVNGYGIVDNIDGAMFISGSLQIGNGATTTYFEDVGDVGIFTDKNVSSTLYKLLFVGSGCNVDIAGGLYKAAGSQSFTFDANDSGLASFTLSGKQIVNADTSWFKAGQSVTGNVFDTCGQIDPSTATFNTNTIKNSVDAGGALLWPTSGNVIDNIFEGNTKAIEVTQTLDQTYNQLTFVSNTHDTHLNNGGNSIDINKTGGSNPSTYTATGGGVVTYVGSVNVTFDGIPSGANCRLYLGTPNNSTSATQEATENNVVDGTFAISTQNGGSLAYLVVITLADQYKILELTLPSTDTTIPVSFTPDRVYST